MNRILIVGFTMLLLSLVVKRYKLKDIVEAFSNDDQHWLIIGIMSAQNNFEARQSIRLTWRKMLMEKKIHYYFLVGHHTCPIPYPDRIDEFSCTEWPIRLHKGVNGSTELSSGTYQCHSDGSQASLFLGFSFITHHQIVIRKFGILSTLLQHLQHVKVILRNSATRERITSATFHASEEELGSPTVITKRVGAYMLPKGFEGQLLVEFDELPKLNMKCKYTWSTAGGIIRFVQLIRMRFENPLAFSEESFSPLIMTFTIHDIGKLKSHIASESDRKRLWLEQTAMLKLNLVAESQEMKDILFLNVIDVYRNLPRKLLQFLQWLHMNKDFSYVMKTDDDTFVDVFAVEKELSEVRKKNFLSTSDVCQFWWWSTFREGWPVQAAGKWREDAYHSSTYPPFPCGAGYVLNNNIVHFLGSNAHILYPNFQGEDVSIGIWLAGLNPCKHSHSNTSCTWSCGEPVSGTACNKAQLSIHSMLHIWSHYQSQSPFK